MKKRSPIFQEKLGYDVAIILTKYELPDILEVLAEHCGIHSERTDDELARRAYLKAMEKLFEVAQSLKR
jgi:hypothetical protein